MPLRPRRFASPNRAGSPEHSVLPEFLEPLAAAVTIGVELMMRNVERTFAMGHDPIAILHQSFLAEPE